MRRCDHTLRPFSDSEDILAWAGGRGLREPQHTAERLPNESLRAAARIQTLKSSYTTRQSGPFYHKAVCSGCNTRQSSNFTVNDIFFQLDFFGKKKKKKNLKKHYKVDLTVLNQKPLEFIMFLR